MQQVKRTPPQVAALHTLESAGIGVLSTVVVAAVQYLSTNGLNITGLGTAAGGTFVGAMLMMYKSLIMNTQVAQGAQDTVGQGWQYLQSELRNIANALTGGKPAQVSAPTSPIAIDVQTLAKQLASELMNVPRPDVTQQATRPSVEAIRQSTPPVQAQPLYAPNPSAAPPQTYPPTTATGTVNWQPPQRPYGG